MRVCSRLFSVLMCFVGLWSRKLMVKRGVFLFNIRKGDFCVEMYFGLGSVRALCRSIWVRFPKAPTVVDWCG